MKKIGEYTCRGTIREGTSTRISLFDGRYDTGYKLKEFYISHIAQEDIFQNTAVAKVATQDVGQGDRWNWDDMREIAWAHSAQDINAPGGGLMFEGLVDPDNMIIEDAFVILNDQFETDCNFMCVFEKYDITEWQGALGMVRARSQG